MLVAQALGRRLPLVTDDRNFSVYQIPVAGCG
jgi:hypothetical protein